ncbi:MAG: hypothetical protein EBZ81_15285 [Betaproteobacteria bacterium]|nr:hypothetical protein [Betaproteobacteria bacterium]
MRKTRIQEINKIYSKSEKRSEPMEPKLFQDVWILDGITYVPHWTDTKIFVGPGGNEYPPEVLQELGGGRSLKMLWVRPWDGKL